MTETYGRNVIQFSINEWHLIHSIVFKPGDICICIYNLQQTMSLLLQDRVWFLFGAYFYGFVIIRFPNDGEYISWIY